MAKILILDDDPQILKMTDLMLKREGHTVLTEKNGNQAIETIKNEAPDILLTDILMPGMDGVEVINQCRKENLDVQIIAMSGGRRKITAEFNLKSATMLGAVAVLEKPFSRERLVSCIRNVVATAA